MNEEKTYRKRGKSYESRNEVKSAVDVNRCPKLYGETQKQEELEEYFVSEVVALLGSKINIDVVTNSDISHYENSVRQQIEKSQSFTANLLERDISMSPTDIEEKHGGIEDVSYEELEKIRNIKSTFYLFIKSKYTKKALGICEEYFENDKTIKEISELYDLSTTTVSYTIREAVRNFRSYAKRNNIEF